MPLDASDFYLYCNCDNELAAGKLKDNSGNENHGALVNTPEFRSIGAIVGSHSIWSNGVDEYYDFGNIAEAEGTDDIAVGLWYKSDENTDGDAGLFGKRTQTAEGWALRTSADGTKAEVKLWADTAPALTGISAINDDAKHFIGFRYGDGYLKLIVDNKLEAIVALSGDIKSEGAAVKLFSYWTDLAGFISKGFIDAAFIAKTSLTDGGNIIIGDDMGGQWAELHNGGDGWILPDAEVTNRRRKAEQAMQLRRR